MNIPVNVGHVDIDWLNRLVLKNVSLDDQDGELLFASDYISVGFKLLPFFQHKWVFTNVRLFGFTLNLNKDTPDGILNLQFVLDAFSAQDSTKQSDIDLQINSIAIRRGNIRYDMANAPVNHESFDSKHIQIQNLNGTIAIKAFNKDSINAHISKLSFDEQSGFRLDKMSMSLAGNKDSISMTALDIRLPRTRLSLDQASIRLDELDSLSGITYDAPVSLQITPSQISLKDFSAFIPALQRFPDIIQLSAKVSGFINDLSLDELVIQQNGAMSVSGMMNLKGMMSPDAMYVFGKVNMHLTSDGLDKIVNGLQEQHTPLPQAVKQLGDLHFTGEISGFSDHLVAYGNLTSDIGALEMDMLFGHQQAANKAFFLNGQVSSTELLISRLLDEENPYGSVRFNVDIDASRPVNGSFSGEIQADIQDFDYNKYRYEHILISGGFRENEFNGSIQIDDPNGKLLANGLFRNNGQQAVFNFAASLSGFKPDKLFLTDRYINPQISLNIGADFTGNTLDNFEGQIQVDNLTFYTQPDSFTMKLFQLKTEGDAGGRTLSIQSDWLNGEITGAYSFSTLLSSMLQTSKRYLPSLSAILQENNPMQENVFSLNMNILNTEALSNTLKLPVTVLQEGEITGHYNNQDNQFKFEAKFPQIKIGNAMLEPCNIVFDNQQDKIQLQADLNHLHKNNSHNRIKLNADGIDDCIQALISIENDRDKSFNLNFSTSTLFVAENESDSKQKLRTEITLNPTEMIIKDSIWTLEPASITILDGNTFVDNFYLSKQDQFMRINGTVSAKNPGESLLVELNDLELSYIFDIISINALKFGGRATGMVYLTDLFGSRILNTDLEIQNFSFNQVIQGKLNLFSEWDNEEEGILLLGTIYKNDTIWTDVNGYIYPMGEKQGLSLYFDATDIDLALLHPYVDAFSEIIEGRGYGKLHLGGSFSKLTFEGKVFVADGRIGVDFLHTDYTFSDTIFVYPTSIQGTNMTIHDKYGNDGIVNFEISHQFLKDFGINVNMLTRNLLIYDTPEKVNPQIYGTIYGDGSVQISGTEKNLTVQANVRSNPGTAVGFNFMNNSAVDNYDFIVFRDAATTNEQLTGNPQTGTNNNSQDDNTDYLINCMVEVTPDANIELVMDPSSGDKIKANGSGNIRIDYGSKTALAMFGGYTIRNGTYNFSMQQLIHKDFQLGDGSRVDFSGDPMEAMLDLNAVYFLTANVEDLDYRLVKEAVRTSVPVNCILNLNGRLQTPDISFDLKFPNSSTELERQVKSVINSDEMMMRQVIYLLVLNRFYTPDYSEGVYTNEVSRVASSALSAQLSYLLNSLTDKVQIGANIRSRQDGITDTEVEMLLSSQLLDNRLIFNGNFGYKNNFNYTNAFIGEFDLEYKLNPSGEIRLKAYNRANDMYRYNIKAQTRQGVGLMFNKDFNSPAEIFRRRKLIN